MFDLDRFTSDCRDALRAPAPELAVKEVVERAMARPEEVIAALGTPASGWAIIGLYGGREDNVFYRRTASGLARAGGKRLETSDVAVLGRSVIHAVTNPLRRYTGAIHVYGGDFFATARSEWDPETLEERPYDVERARRTFAQANARWQAEAARAGT